MNRQPQRSILTAGASVALTCLLATTALQAESVAIKIETQKGKPIEGATVSVRDNEAGVVVDSALTSNDGVAVIQALTPGEWYFEIDRPGYMLYTAYVQIRAGKKPELGFASQVSRGDDWEPMRVKFVKASPKLMRQAVIAAPAEPRTRQTVRVEPESGTRSEPGAEVETRPQQLPAPEPAEPTETEPTTTTVAVPSTVEAVEPETEVTTGQESGTPELNVADGDPEPLADAAGGPLGTPIPTATGAKNPGTDIDSGADPGAAAQGESQPAIADDAEAAPERPFEAPADEPAGEPVPAPVQDPQAVEPQPQSTAEPAEPAPTEAEPADAAEAAALPLPAQPSPETPPADEPQPSSTPSRILVPATATSASVRSAAAGNCPECGQGEWAVSADVAAATAGDTRSTSTCAPGLQDRVEGLADQLVNRTQSPFAGSLMAGLWRTGDDEEREAMAELAAEFNSPQGFCQVAAVVLPPGAAMTGYALEAWDELGGRACNADGICALPKAGWSGPPTVVSGDHATVVFAVFRNRSTRHQRSAELTVLFNPPPESQ